MKLFLAYILNIFSIFEVQTHFITNEKYFKNFKELKDRREIESISTSTDFSSADVFCSDLSAFARKFKQFIMQNTSESLLAQNSNETKVSKKYDLDFQENIFTASGFYLRFFSYLPNSRSLNEAFVKASVDYYNIYQSFKYSSFVQFRNSTYGTSK